MIDASITTERPRIAITMGDPAGVGPELCLQLLAEPAVLACCVPIVIGDASVLQSVGQQLELPVPSEVVSTEEWSRGSGRFARPVVVDLSLIAADQVQPATVSAAHGEASYHYIDLAISETLAGRCDAITTGPINKEALHAAGIHFPGHTEIFAEKTDASRSCMLQVSQEVTCSFVTTHVGYSEVPDLISTDRILDVFELSRDAIARIHQREAKLLVCGLNPHAGEHGLFGDREEERFIVPAIQAARERGIDVHGPVPPDTAFLPQRRREFDCIVCMYHDQGHIPLKALAFDVAVNTTLGLPIIRTSVDHGTAFDIAWQGKASVSSFIEAVTLAAKLARTPAST